MPPFINGRLNKQSYGDLMKSVTQNDMLLRVCLLNPNQAHNFICGPSG